MNKLLRLQNLIASIFVATSVVTGFVATAPALQAEDEGEAPANNPSSDAGLVPAATEGESEETALGRVVKRYADVFKEVDAALFKADGYIAAGRTDDALSLLSEAESALPDNVASVPLRDKIAILRQRAIATQNGVAGTALAETMIEEARVRNRLAILSATRFLDKADDDLTRHRLVEATENVDKARDVLPLLPSTMAEQDRVKMLRAKISAAYFADMVANRSPKEAEAYLNEVKNIVGEKDRFYINLRNYYDSWVGTAEAYDPYLLSATLKRDEVESSRLLAKAKSLYLFGDYQGALRLYDEVLLFDPDDTEAKAGKLHIQNILANPAAYEHDVTRVTLLNSTSNGWGLAKAFTEEKKASATSVEEDPIKLKMDRLLISVTLRNADLQSAVETLNELAKSADSTGRGLDLVVTTMEGKTPDPITLSIQSQPLSKVLDLILRLTGFSYEIKDGIVEISPASGATNVNEVEIPSTNAFEKMKKSVSRQQASAPSAGASNDPWGGGADSAGGEVDDTDVPRIYLEKRGVKFGEGEYITCDENVFTVAHADSKVIEKIRRIIQKLDEDSIKQVNIEAKFIEVSDTVLHEVTANWRLAKDGVVRSGTYNRTASEVHSVSTSSKTTQVITPESSGTDSDGNDITQSYSERSYETSVPTLPTTLNYGPSSFVTSDYIDPTSKSFFSDNIPSFVGKIGTLDDYDVYLLLNLLDNKSGADVMAAPSLTVETEQSAEIEIAQLLNFPSSYDDPTVEVRSGTTSSNSDSTSSSGAVSLSPSVPQFDRTTSEEFEKIGIVLNVTPTVNADNSIKLAIDDLKIMEFEGFMDYGGTSVSMVGSTIVTMPMTYYQPVFNIRRVKTSVTIADGATMVIGGLMREEIRTVEDKVPILGDLPLIGSAFRGTSKAVQKKNLLVFITGNLISRGGSTALSKFKGRSAAEIYSNPTLMTSAGPLYRETTRTGDSSTSGSSEASAPSSAGSL